LYGAERLFVEDADAQYAGLDDMDEDGAA